MRPVPWHHGPSRKTGHENSCMQSPEPSLFLMKALHTELRLSSPQRLLSRMPCCLAGSNPSKHGMRTCCWRQLAVPLIPFFVGDPLSTATVASSLIKAMVMGHSGLTIPAQPQRSYRPSNSARDLRLRPHIRPQAADRAEPLRRHRQLKPSFEPLSSRTSSCDRKNGTPRTAHPINNRVRQDSWLDVTAIVAMPRFAMDSSSLHAVSARQIVARPAGSYSVVLTSRPSRAQPTAELDGNGISPPGRQVP